MFAHNQLLGWVYGFKLNDNNALFATENITIAPYKVIVPNPTIGQCLSNWNLADTGAVLATVFLSGLVCLRLQKHTLVTNILDKRSEFLRIITMSWIFGGLFGIRNSSYRLQGLVPNGLEIQVEKEPIKYDYTSKFLETSIWSAVFDSNRKSGNRIQ